MPHIKEILSDIVGSLKKDKKRGVSEKLIDAWREISGEKISAHTLPYKFKNKILYIKVDESTWAYELSQKYKALLINKINSNLKEQIIGDLIFHVGEING